MARKKSEAKVEESEVITADSPLPPMELNAEFSASDTHDAVEDDSLDYEDDYALEVDEDGNIDHDDTLGDDVELQHHDYDAEDQASGNEDNAHIGLGDDHGDDDGATQDSKRASSNLLEGMQFTLSCEVGSINMSINELSKMKVGDSLDFVSDLQQVKIKINSVVVGFGQIVDFKGKYGIKINKILSIYDKLGQ